MKKETLWSLLTQPSTQPLWESSKNFRNQARDLAPRRPRIEFSLDEEITRFSQAKVDRWTLRDAVRGTITLGGIGSGKTSGSGKKIAASFLEKGMGGLVLCVKTDEASQWAELASALGREKDLIRITADSPYGFNFLDWEQKRGEEIAAGFVANITNFFIEIISVIDRSHSSRGDDAFWDRTLRTLISNAIVIASHLSDTLGMALLLKVIELAPKGSEVQESFDSICNQARTRCPSEKLEELEASIHFFSQSFANLADKTRSIVMTSFTSMADPLLREPLLKLFCKETVVRPEDAFEGKIIVVDLPVHSFQFLGRIASLIWKAAFKRACQSRIDPRVPVFLWIDECQYLVDPTDGEFQTTARSSLCCTVLLTQTISSLYAELGNQSKVDALMSCLHTKIFHQNSDHVTNAWASKTIQKMPFTIRSESRPKAPIPFNTTRDTVTESIHWEDDVPARTFLNLKSGGPENRYIVEGIVFYPGRQFSSGKPWVRAVFDQRRVECDLRI